jgi:hypothetical protein
MLCQNRSARIYRIKLSRSPSFSSRIKKESYLEHVAPMSISCILELELHDRMVYFAHLCQGLTRIELSFLETIDAIG